MNNYKVSEKRETVLLTKNQLARIIIHSFFTSMQRFYGASDILSYVYN